MSNRFAVTYVMLGLAHLLAVLMTAVMLVALVVSAIAGAWGPDQGTYLIILGVAMVISGVFHLVHNIHKDTTSRARTNDES